MQTIAVLITCHNRKVYTLACLDRLYSQTLPQDVALSVYLVDDGCSDGTAKAVREAYPTTNILQGDGSLFWCNGMRLAWQVATKSDPDFYLWLNDDTMLHPNCITVLMNTWSEAIIQSNNGVLVVGSTRDPDTLMYTYGGQSLCGRHPVRATQVIPDNVIAKHCDTFNGNCVFIPRYIYQTVGMMRSFTHAMSDIDYGLLARRAGVQIIVAPGYIGECRGNPISTFWSNRSLPRKQRWRLLLSHRGLPPRDWWKLLWRHGGLYAFIYWPVPYLRVIIGL
jgi:GT2 family glycosyltransferase